jgi:hypothetical protein
MEYPFIPNVLRAAKSGAPASWQEARATARLALKYRSPLRYEPFRPSGVVTPSTT